MKKLLPILLVLTLGGCMGYYVEKARTTCAELYPDDALEQSRCAEDLLRAGLEGSR